MTTPPTAEDAAAIAVIEFWVAAGPAAWFRVDPAFDISCGRWRGLVEQAASGALDRFAATAAGSLALVLLLDQFPRNLFRGTPRAFATDEKALAIANAAIARGCDRAFPVPLRNFFYLPFMHAEDIAAQERCIDLFRRLGDHDALLHAFLHHDAIRRFGRFPHRNAILGRPSTPEEDAWLAAGGLSP